MSAAPCFFLFLKQQNSDGALLASFGGRPLFFGIFWGQTGGLRWGYQRQGTSRPGGRVQTDAVAA